MRARITSSVSCARVLRRRSSALIAGGSTKMLAISRGAPRGGHETTTTAPRRPMVTPWFVLPFPPAISPIPAALFQILHLLAELLDHALEFEADIGQLDVVRLGA